MSRELYHQIQQVLAESVDAKVSASSLERLTLLVVGIIKAEQASPARISAGLKMTPVYKPVGVSIPWPASGYSWGGQSGWC